jgi:hypothetical protein
MHNKEAIFGVKCRFPVKKLCEWVRGAVPLTVGVIVPFIDADASRLYDAFLLKNKLKFPPFSLLLTSFFT